MDVEGLNWAPVGGQAIADNFEEFEIRLNHGTRLPDERLDPASLFPVWHQSGMRQGFGVNQVANSTHGDEVVHDRSCGYTINPGDLFTT